MINIQNYFSSNDIKKTGAAKYQARCPAHNDKTASLTIYETPENILMHCHAGCDIQNIVSALGLSIWDLTNKTESFKRLAKQASKTIRDKQQFEKDYIHLRITYDRIKSGHVQSEQDILLSREAYNRLDKYDVDLDKLYEDYQEQDYKQANLNRVNYFREWAASGDDQEDKDELLAYFLDKHGFPMELMS